MSDLSHMGYTPTITEKVVSGNIVRVYEFPPEYWKALTKKISDMADTMKSWDTVLDKIEASIATIRAARKVDFVPVASETSESDTAAI